MSKNLLNILLAISSFAVYYLIINPLYTGVGSVWQPSQSVTSLRDLNTKYTEAIAQASALQIQADTLKTQYSGLSDESKQKMEVMVPDSIDPVRLINEVSNIGNQSGLFLGNLAYNTSPASNANKQGSYVVSFSVTTTYPKFKELMHNIETSLRLFTIKSVAFTIPAKDNSLIDFQVKLETYYMK